MEDKAYDIEALLLSMADERQARQLMRFFKTGPGQYGEGDKFIGLYNPQVRAVVKEAWRTTPLPEAATLAASPWHEARLCGLLIIVEKFLKAMKRKDSAEMDEILSLYLSIHPNVNNWDLVDMTAPKIVGNYEALNPQFTLMDDWIMPEGHTIWQQRISMVSTWMLMRHDRFEECFSRADVLLSAEHDLLRKAAGWMLREAYKRGRQERVCAFLEANIGRISAVTLSYACEKMPPAERHYYQSLRRK